MWNAISLVSISYDDNHYTTGTSIINRISFGLIRFSLNYPDYPVGET